MFTEIKETVSTLAELSKGYETLSNRGELPAPRRSCLWSLRQSTVRGVQIYRRSGRGLKLQSAQGHDVSDRESVRIKHMGKGKKD